MSRYSRRVTAINFEEQYDKMFEQRGVLQIEQYRTPISRLPSGLLLFN